MKAKKELTARQKTALANHKKKGTHTAKHMTIMKEKRKVMPRKKGVSLSVGRGEKSKKGGLTAKGRAKYNRATGSNLQAPVTEKNPTGKRAARRKSFCARMKGMPGPLKDKKGRPTRKALALKRWRC